MNLIPCAFVWFVAVENDKSYLLLQHRADGMFGTPGGKVEAGETIIEALIREINEEANINGIIHSELDVLTIGVFDSPKYQIHAFVKEISLEYMKWIRKNYYSASHAEEVAGMSILQLTEGSINNLLQLPFAGSGYHEIKKVLEFLRK